MNALPFLVWAAIPVLLIAAELRARSRPDKPNSTENLAILIGFLAIPVVYFARYAGVYA